MTDYKGVAETLLPDLRNDQDITWDDGKLDDKLKGYAARGMSTLDRLAGYMRAGAANEFMSNYSREILMLRQMQEVESFAPDENTDLS